MRLFGIAVLIGPLILVYPDHAAAASAQDGASPKNPETTAGPRITFESPLIDFGTVVGGQSGQQNVVFRNEGNATLRISDATPNCGCITSTNWTSELRPGISGVIPLTFDSQEYSGPVSKSLKISCNDPQQS